MHLWHQVDRWDEPTLNLNDVHHSVIRMPIIHLRHLYYARHRPPTNDTQFEVDEYGNKIQSKAMLQLSESLADMYNGIKGHVKNIRSFQKKSDNMNYKDDYGEDRTWTSRKSK